MSIRMSGNSFYAATYSPAGFLPEQPFGLQVFIVQEGIIGVHAQTLLVPRLTLYSVCAQTLQWVGQATVLFRVQRYHLPIPHLTFPTRSVR